MRHRVVARWKDYVCEICGGVIPRKSTMSYNSDEGVASARHPRCEEGAQSEEERRRARDRRLGLTR